MYLLTCVDFSKVNHIGQFVSLDGRPLSSSRGISQDIVKSFKSYLRSAASKCELSKAIVDPFLCLQLQCPRGAYDVNIEPGKDDVLFEDREMIMSLVENLFQDCYGQLPESTTRSPARNKSASSGTAAKATGFNVLMARKRTDRSPPTQSINAREILLSRSIRNPLLHSQVQPHVTVSPAMDESRDSQSDYVAEDHSPVDRNSCSINPWSVTKMSTSLQTPGQYGRNVANRISLSPASQHIAPERSRAGPTLRQGPRSPPETPHPHSSEHQRTPSGSPVSRGRIPESSGSPTLLKALTASSSKRAARERDRERYGNGALDTWFERTTQISMGQTPLDQPASIDELVPTLSQLAKQRFGTEEDGQEDKNDLPESSPNIPTGKSGDVGSPSSPGDQESTADAPDTSMNSGRGYPVLEHWAASLKDGFNAEGSSGLEWAMDFERRKKEANQRHRTRPTLNQQSSEPSSQQRIPQASQGPHQNRFLAAKAALDVDRPFAPAVTSNPAIPLHDPRAYLMLHESSKKSKNRLQEGKISRRHHSSSLPFERIPDGHDLHDVCLSVSTDLPSISNFFELATSHDSYINGGKDALSFHDPTIDTLVPIWTRRLQSIIARQYKGSGDHPSPDQADLDSVIAKHVKLHY